MKANVKLKLGNIFEGPCDLIVLPCSTEGTVTSMISKYLFHFNINWPKNDMSLGEVDIKPLEGAENIAQFVAFAASVRGYSSSIDAIEKIGRTLGRFTQNNDCVKNISVPLLGGGAGGMSANDSVKSLRNGFLANANPESTMTIFVLNNDAYNEILKNLEAENNNIVSPKTNEKDILRVFISYSSTTDKHQEWVISLGTFLRENGINARLDVWHLRVGMDLPQWMCNELKLADKVLIVSDEKYAQKADGRYGGVGWETMVIQGDLSTLPPINSKYVVVVTTEEIESGLPTYLKTKYIIHWKECQEKVLKKRLLEELYDVEKAPTIKNRPVFI